MHRRRKRAKLDRKHRFFLRLCAVLAVLLLLFIALDREVRPVILTMAGYQARVSSILAINNAVLEEMQQSDLSADLVTVHRNADGNVTAIETNTSELNLLKAQLTSAVGQKLAAIQRTNISIPFGTLLGWQLFAGRGPNVNFKVVPASFVESDIRSTLTDAGINQTRHQIFITFSVEMTAIIPGYTTSVNVQTEICIADTLVVGQVPEFYAAGSS